MTDVPVPNLHPEANKWSQTPRFMHQKHLKLNVLEAAKARTRWIIENFDEVWVSFSGGKDSLVCLSLMEMVSREMSRTEPINVRFMDEELVQDDIIDFVQKMADTGRFNFRWYCLNMYVGFFVMGKHRPFVTWEKDRVWHRQPPAKDYVVYDVGADTKECNENTIAQHIFRDTTKRYCSIVGIRADESMKRFLSVSRGGAVHPNYVSADFGKHSFVAKPIYDWTELDVFKFFKDHDIQYCPCYDQQVWAKTPLRVASALHERAASQFFKLKSLSPKFYEQLRAVYPEIETHYRYYAEMAEVDPTGVYAHTFDGIRDYVANEVDESHRAEALKYIGSLESMRAFNLKNNPHAPLGMISVLQTFNGVKSGRFVKGSILNHTISQGDIDYESSIA